MCLTTVYIEHFVKTAAVNGELHQLALTANEMWSGGR